MTGDYFTGVLNRAGISMASITTGEYIAAGVGAGAVLVASVPVWVNVAQVRRRRLKDDINDAVNAKTGELVGGAFTNLLQLQRDAESNFKELRTSLESDAARVTAIVQGELNTILPTPGKLWTTSS